MHMKHVPLNCTENHCAYYKSCISLTVQHVTVILFLGNGSRIASLLVRVVFDSRQEERGQTESSTVILTFPFISFSVISLLSGLSIFVSTVQRQLAWPTESRTARGRGRPACKGRNERRRRPDCQSSHQACWGF